MSTPVTFLQLSPEFGGTKFGPFAGVEIRLGSDPSRNDIVLPEALGVMPEHVKVLKQQDGSFILAPTHRTATIFLWRNDGRAPRQITTPTAISAGDGFSLVTAEGPRFFIVRETERQAASGGAEVQKPKGKDDKGVGQGIMAEMKRMGISKFLTTKVGNSLQTAWTMVKTGTIFSPRYIVMGMMMFIPLVLAGGASCAAFSFQRSSAKKSTQIDELKSDLEACGAGDEADPTVASLTQAILGDREWQQSMETDPEFMATYLKRVKSIFEREDRYTWVYKRPKSQFATLASRMERDMGPGLSRVFAYVAAHEGYVSDRQWGMIQSNSEGQRACGRGPALLSYRQAKNLGMSIQPDALVDAGVAASEDLELKAAAIRATLGMDEREFELEEIMAEGAGLQGGFQCLYLEGEDDRSEITALSRALGKALGVDARGLPSEGDNHWITSRLAKFFAADFLIGFEELDLSDGIPSVILDEVAPQQKEYVVREAADVTARAVAIPCLAILDKGAEPKHMGELPSLVQCGVLRLLVDRE